MSNLKWADVAHYYAKSDHDVRLWWISDEEGRKGITRKAQFSDFKDGYAEEFHLTPILRHLEDMTRVEAKECFEIDGILWEHSSVCDFFDTPKAAYSHTFKKEPSHWQLTPKEMHYLISKGFDVFGLIESGQTIRKGVEGA